MATVSDTATETTLQLYANPLLIQDQQLSLFEEHVFEGKSVLDGNNVFTFGLEMDATMTASIVNEMVNNFQALYPARAQTMSDLYRHLSDYDYIDLFSTPSTTTIELIFDRDFIIDNAPVNADNNLENVVILPEFSKFKIGEHVFGIHYPIKITLRKAYKSDGVTIDYDNCIFQVVWDTTNTNPLYRLTSNVLEHRVYQKNGLNLFCIAVPVQQFKTDIRREDTISSTGFIKRYVYEDNFYAIRIFHYWNDTWVEMSETLSDVIYNPNEPVAKVKVLSDIHMVEVSIPQVCFTEGLIGNRIMCVIYMTEGELNLDIRNFTTDQFSASFLVDDQVVDTTYSAFLKRVPYLQMVPLSTRISSGSNGKSFEEMKNRVINTVGGDDLLVTPAQIAAHLRDIGFNVSKYIDNITDRIYLASKTLTDSNNNIIASGEFKTTFTNSTLFNAGKAYNTIKVINDGIDKCEYMIMPDTIFKYNSDTDSMYPLTRYEVKKIFQTMSTEEKIKELNENIYTFTPFHIKLSANTTLPMAGAYDLLKPKLENVTFSGENVGTISQISMYANYIEHLNNGMDGYDLSIALYTTENLEGVIPVLEDGTENFVVILRTISSDDTPIYLKGVYAGINSDNKYLFKFKIRTNYKVDEYNRIDTTTFTPINDYATEPTTNFVKLKQSYEMMFFAHKSIVDDSEAMTITNTLTKVPSFIFKKGYVWLATQKFDIELGKPISNLMSNVALSIQGQRYDTYRTTEYATYISDVYQRYEHEEEEYAKVRLMEDEVIYVKEGQVYYKKNGDDYITVLEDELPVGAMITSNNPYYQKITHMIGDLKYDQNLNLYVERYAGDLILANATIDIANEDYTGLRAPAFTIKSPTDDIDSNIELVNGIETLYMASGYRTATADAANVWYPFRAYRDPETEEYKVVYTGSTQNKNGAVVGYQASIVRVHDLLETMMNSIDRSRDIAMIDTVLHAGRVWSEFSDNGTLGRHEGYEEKGGKLYLTAKDPHAVPFIYIKDATDDITNPPFKILKQTGENAEHLSINKYVLEAQEVNADSISAMDRDRDVKYGALYRRDIEASEFDWGNYLDEQELIAYFQEIDKLDKEDTDYSVKLQKIYTKFNLDSTVAEKLNKFRFPWVKVLETAEDSYKHIRRYWNSRSYNNFMAQYEHTSDPDPVEETLDENYTLSFVTQNRGVEVSGVNALRYLQERCLNVNEINDTYVHTTQEALIAVNADDTFRLYWIANYDASLDGTAINWDGSRTNIVPLIGELPTKPYETKGALLWATHSSVDLLSGKHYVVMTGPSKLACYNELHSINTFSGMCYRCDVYDASEFICAEYGQVSTYELTQDTEVVDGKSYYKQSVTSDKIYTLIVNPTGNPNDQGWYELEPRTYATESEAELASEHILTYNKVSDQTETPSTPVKSYVCVFTNNITSSIKDVDLRLVDASVWEAFWPWESTNWFVEDAEGNIQQSITKAGISMTIGGSSITDAKILHMRGDIMMDENGIPVNDSDENTRKLIYNVNMIHCDYKLLESSSSDYTTYREDIQELLRSYFEVLTATKPQLLERTELYFTPIKSMGYGVFKSTNNQEVMYPLEISVALRVYISASIGSNENTKEQIRQNIITLIENHIANGSITCTALANEIRNAMSDSILYIDVLGINGDTDTQTLISTDPSKYSVRLKTLLVKDEDGSIVTEKGVDISWSVMN